MPARRWRSPVHLGFLAGAALVVAADAVHWFLTGPVEVGATGTWLAGGQLVVGLTLCVWAFRRGKAIEEGT